MKCGAIQSTQFDLCSTSIGGLSKVYMIDFDDVTNVAIGEVSGVTGEMVTGITLSGTSKFQEFTQKKNSATWSSEYTSTDNGGYIQTTLHLVFPRMDAAKAAAANSLLLASAAAICLDKNGKYWYLGRLNPLEISSGSASVGTSRDDQNAYVIEVQDEDIVFPYEVDPKIVPNLIATE